MNTNNNNNKTTLAVFLINSNICVTDPEGHILFFDIESLIIELLSEEYSAMSPNSLEAAGLISQSEYSKIAMITQSAGADAHKKIAGKSVLFIFYIDFLTVFYVCLVAAKISSEK